MRSAQLHLPASAGGLSKLKNGLWEMVVTWFVTITGILKLSAILWKKI